MIVVNLYPWTRHIFNNLNQLNLNHVASHFYLASIFGFPAQMLMAAAALPTTYRSELRHHQASSRFCFRIQGVLCPAVTVVHTQDFYKISLPNISMPFRWKGSWQSLAMLGIKTWEAPDRSAPVLVAVEVVWTQDVAMKILQALTATCEGETLVLRMWDDLGITRERQIHLRLLQRHLRLHRPLLKAPSHGCSHSYRKQPKKAYASAPWNPCISKDTITRFDELRSVNPMMWTALPFGMRRIGSVGASKDGKQHHGVQQICDSS